MVSGGMDSATLLYSLSRQGAAVRAVSFNYGQRHAREVESAETLCRGLDVPWELVDVRGVGPLLSGSALTDLAVDVPHGHYEAETMKATVVPGRNSIMLSIAWGIAIAHDLDAVAFGVHAGDHAIYPDCRPEWAAASEAALRIGTGAWNMSLLTPFIAWSKTDIAELGCELGVPYEQTWTCYEGGDKHCGKCGACQERKEAFRDSGNMDPTQYAA